MSNVLANRQGRLRGYPVKAAIVIASSSLVLFDATGYAIPQASAPGTAKLLGVSTHQADNTDGAAGAIKVEVNHDEVFLLNSGDVTKTHVGTKVYLSDTNKVSIDSNTNAHPAAGTVTQVDDDGVWVKPEIV